MNLNLNELVSVPDARWFHLALTDMGMLERVDENEADLSLKLLYCDKVTVGKLRERALSRRPINTKGMKALLGSDDLYREYLVVHCLKDWKLTKKGLTALRAEMNLDALADDEQIVFNEINVKALVAHGQLGQEVSQLVTDHPLWYGKPEDEDDEEDGAEGNSVTGPKRSSAASVPVVTA